MAQQTRHGLYGGPRQLYDGFTGKAVLLPEVVISGSPLVTTEITDRINVVTGISRAIPVVTAIASSLELT